MYSNVDGLLNKKDELISIIEKDQPIIIALIEIKPKRQYHFNIAEYNIPGYTFFVINKTKRGVAIYTHVSLNEQLFNTINDRGLEESVYIVNITDLVLVNDEFFITEIEHCCPLGKSDHQPLNFSIQLDCLLDHNICFKTVFDSSKADFDGLRDHFSNYNDWTLLINLDIKKGWNLIKKTELAMV